jgi:membrane protein implicated in regulation of membrane protease activity
MVQKDLSSSSSSSNATANTTKIEGVIVVLTLLIKIGKFLPWIVLAFAAGNMTVAVLYFTWWNSMAWGIFNLVLAAGGFLFFAQLVRRRKIHRQNYLQTRKYTHKETAEDIHEQGKVTAAEVGEG